MSCGVEGPKGGKGGEGGGEPGSGGIVGGGGACDVEGSQPPSVTAVGFNRWEAGFACEDGGGGGVIAVGDPSADPMPEGVHSQGGAVVRDQEVGSVSKDGEKQSHGDPVGQEGAGPSSWGGEAFHEEEGSVG